MVVPIASIVLFPWVSVTCADQIPFTGAVVATVVPFTFTVTVDTALIALHVTVIVAQVTTLPESGVAIVTEFGGKI